MISRPPLLSGRLDAFPAQEVLQWLAHRRGETLAVFRPAPGACAGALVVGVRDGIALQLERVPTAAEEVGRGPGGLDPQAGRLGAYAVRQGCLTVGQVRAGLGIQRLIGAREETPPLGRLFEQLGWLGSERLEDLLASQALDRLADLFDCRTGEFFLYAGRLAGPGLPIERRIDHLLLSVAHRLDLRRRVPSTP